MAKEKNAAIGEVECPAKNCARVVPVYRFKPRQNEKMQRFANKLYCRCPAHGQFGGTVGDDAMQEYLEENSRKCEPKSAGNANAAPANLNPAEPAKKSEIPQKVPAMPATAKPATPATTTPEPAPKKPFFYWK